MTRTFCDLCGEEITSWSSSDRDKIKWKLKYFYEKPPAKGWCLIDAHETCLRAVAKEARLHGVKMKGGNE